jgi:hypothetical protein
MTFAVVVGDGARRVARPLPPNLLGQADPARLVDLDGRPGQPSDAGRFESEVSKLGGMR